MGDCSESQSGARALCATCDGIGIVGDDDPGRYPTPCPACSEEDAA